MYLIISPKTIQTDVINCILGAIYLKNLITQSWAEPDHEPGAVIPFSIHEQDRSMIRNLIVEAIIHAPDLIRFVRLLL